MAIFPDQQGVPDFAGALVWTPGELQDEARSVNVDMVTTDNASASAPADLKAGWDTFYAAWKVYFDPIDQSWTWNILTGAAAWANIDQIRDWRTRLIEWQKSLQSSGVQVAVSAQQSSAAPPALPAGMLGDLSSIVKWAVIGGVVIVGAVYVLPRFKKKGA